MPLFDGFAKNRPRAGAISPKELSPPPPSSKKLQADPGRTFKTD
jgi:hypothetical protein